VPLTIRLKRGWQVEGGGLFPRRVALKRISLGEHALLEVLFLRDRTFQTLSLSRIVGKRILVGCPGGFPPASGRILIELGLIQSFFGPVPLLGAPDQDHRRQQGQASQGNNSNSLSS